MSYKPKTASERAEEYAEIALGIAPYFHNEATKYSGDEWRDISIYKHAFLTGRTDFIENDLPDLLEMAREKETMSFTSNGCCHAVSNKYNLTEILAEARRL